MNSHAPRRLLHAAAVCPLNGFAGVVVAGWTVAGELAAPDRRVVSGHYRSTGSLLPSSGSPSPGSQPPARTRPVPAETSPGSGLSSFPGAALPSSPNGVGDRVAETANGKSCPSLVSQLCQRRSRVSARGGRAESVKFSRRLALNHPPAGRVGLTGGSRVVRLAPDVHSANTTAALSSAASSRQHGDEWLRYLRSAKRGD